ncbi:MAG: hypothetical protein IT443_05270 [Phycisphaeraceae bacterium]|nr:hypothetical protein [Phycisphaeraceae bacterium]
MSSRIVMELTTPWLMQPDQADKGELLGFHLADHDDRQWLPAPVPGTVVDACPDLYGFLGPAWFRRHFSVPADWAHRHVVVRFESVTDHCRVYLNSQLVGANDDGYLPFEIDLSAALRPGTDNVLAVWIDNMPRQQDLPGFERGWRTYCGIMREVNLIVTDQLRLQATRLLRAEPDSAGGNLELEIDLANRRAQATEAAVEVVVRDATGKELAKLSAGPAPIANGGAATLNVTGPVPKAQPWSPRQPTLYQLEVRLLENGREIDRFTLRTGFRTIQVRDEGLLLNGQPLVLTGFDRHEDSPRTGLCPDLDIVKADLQAIKRAGGNFVRMAHYPHHPAELDLCDEMGILVMDEIPLYWWRGLHLGQDIFKAKRGNARRQLTTMIQRDRHHPCVIFWSVSNETHENLPEVREGNADLIRHARKLDPTRLATHVASQWHEQMAFEADDVICVNGYPSIHLDRWRNLPDDFDQVMNKQPLLPEFNWETARDFWRRRLECVHQAFPGKPIVITEYGHPGVKGVCAGHMSEQRQARVIENDPSAMTAPYMAGITIWCWADHTWHETLNSPMTIAYYGVVTRDRQPKLGLEAAARAFAAFRQIPRGPAART